MNNKNWLHMMYVYVFHDSGLMLNGRHDIDMLYVNIL